MLITTSLQSKALMNKLYDENMACHCLTKVLKTLRSTIEGSFADC